MNTAEQEKLQIERDTLLESIRRLDDDVASGTISESEYIDLRDEQTVRVARVLEALDSSAPAAEESRSLPVAPLRVPALSSIGSKIYWIVGVAAFALVAVFGVVSAADGRLSGDNTTGSVAGDSNTLLARAAKQSGKGNVADAVKTYDQVLEQDPRNVQALAYRGWLIRLAGLPDQGLESMNAALVINPNYADAHFFKGFTLFRDKNDPKAAVIEFKSFLANNPPEAMVPLVQQSLADAEAQAATQK